MSFRILTDTCCNLNQDQVDEFNLIMIPLTFIIDGVEKASFTDGKVADFESFYQSIRAGKVATTSLAESSCARQVIKELLENGEDILYLGFDSAISGTYNVVSTALDDLAKDYPERKALHVDTLNASVGQGLTIYLAHKLREQGASIEECAAWVEDNKLSITHRYTVDDLMYLHRGGRLSKASAVLGTMLGIKPVLRVDEEGKLVVVEKARSRKKALALILDHFEQTAQLPHADQPVFIAHSDCLEDAESLKKDFETEFGCKEVVISYIDPVIGAHTGPDCIVTSFMTNQGR